MEVELVTEEGMLEEDHFGVDDNNTDYSNFEAERCGICMDIVVDRGVLDCCQHWFCFTCIDNWATITNLCPLCQNEFQLITCVPVYDTIGSNNADEDLESRDDDWCIEGKNNTLSFPSYYIDENAVVCLDGDGCKVRSVPESIEEYSNLDTSIACDSCDVWYHAFCVGFDPEATCENSWLCPRCTVNLMPQKSNEVLVLRPSNQHDLENSSGECFVDAAFSGKVMISVADAGETAVVVSMLEGKQWTEEQNQKISSLDVCKDPKIDTIETATVKENKGTEKHTLEAPFQVSESVSVAGEKVAIEGNEGTEEGRRKFFSSFSVSKDLKTDTSMLSSFANNHKLETPSNERISIEPNSMAEELELSLSQGTSFTSPSNSLLSTELKTVFVDKARSTPSVSDGFGTSSNKLFGQLYNNESLESGLDLHLGLSVSTSLSVDKTNNKLAEDQVAVGVQLKNNLGECPLPADETIIDKKKNIDGISGAKRKHRDWRGAEDGEIKAKIGSKVLSKKVNAEGNNQLVHSRNQADECVLEDAQKSPTVSKDRKLRGKSERKNVTTSIMDIVQGTESRPKGLPQASLAEMSSGKRENAAGLRVKKIMRRPTEDKESSILVQKLRKEIRDAVQNKTSKELGDNLYDPKLLAAFRAAVAGPIAETKKSLPVDLKAKKSLLQKGKVRESLTKKIYGIGGRRRRAWNRDCEIEFWKYRCSKFSRPEKIETLNSVLNLLRKSSESTEINQGNEKAASNSILSRLYLADASVFPRKDDIKPLSTLKVVGISGQNKEVSSTEKAFRQSLGNDFSKTPCTNAIPSQIKTPIFSEVTKRTFPMVKGEASSSILHSNRCSEGPTISKLGGSKSNSQKEIVGKSDDNKADKRKWAQQFLARKAAVTGKDASQEQEDGAVLKGNHTLLAQLPRDMRPVLAISRHNKIPTSIRQAQLHRLTEHFLRKANMPVNRRTAEIELAVADAVNIEKEVADRSNSKLVYVNLCSQELLHRSDTVSFGRATKSDPNPTSEVPTDRSVEATDDHSSCLEVDEALRNAGLLSDSPPNSPHHQMEEIEEVNTSKTLEQEGPDNVFEMDSQPELDIYGDFEYDLEDEDFISASALKLSELQPGEPKLKVVFSTIDSDRSKGAQDFEDHEEPTIVEELEGSSNLLGSLTNTSSGRSNVNDKTDNCDPQSSLLDEGGEELSLAECEELYGPDKEPLMKKFPERASMKPDEPKNSEDNGSNHTLKASDLDRETCAENLAIPTVVRHSSGGEDEPSQSQKNTSRKEKMHKMDIRKKNDGRNSSVYKKVEAYIKEHIRPLCKSGVITVEQYRWAVGKTTDKILKHHSKDTNANFLIKEGEKVKKLAEQYVEAAQRTE